MLLLSCKLKILWAFQIAVLQSNIGNIHTTRTPEGGPYKHQRLECATLSLCDIKFEDKFVLKYEPDHPDSDSLGYVQYPGYNLDDEIKNLIEAESEFALHEHQCAQAVN